MIWINLFIWITAIIAIASFIAAVTPTPQGDKLLAKLYKVVDFCALNIGRAKEIASAEKKDGDS
jgi:hypothetical protein|tara:strand:- start:408 stop:599 length:192 start_codon:yes stop_codon:yes gene_type:complete